MNKLSVIILVCFTFSCNGKNGTDGADGESCSVEPVEGGALIRCEDGTQAFLEQPRDGIDGNNAWGCTLSRFDGYFCIDCPGSNVQCTDTATYCPENSSLSQQTVATCECDLGFNLTCMVPVEESCFDWECVPDECIVNNLYYNGVCDESCSAPDPDCQ